MTTTESTWSINIKPALDALQKLRASIGLTDKKAAEGFDRSAWAAKRARDEMGRFVASSKKGTKSLGGSIDGLNKSLGTVATGLGSLVAGFGIMSAAGVAAFAAVTAEGVALNAEAELTRLSLTQIFGGNEKAAEAFMTNVSELAIRLGTSRQELTGLAKGILPDVGSIEGTAELLENVIVLGRDAGQGIDSIRIATEEALSGNLSSLGRRLNIPKQTLESIKEYQKEMSLADAINKGLGERIAQTGISADVTADSFVTLAGKIRGNIENFKLLLGESPFEELKEQAEEFLTVLDEQGPEIELVAKAFGDLSAKVVDFVGSNLTKFIEGIDYEAVEGLIDGISDAVDAGELLLDVFFEMDEGSLFDNLISGLTTVVDKLKDATTTGSQLVLMTKAANARQRGEAEAYKKILEENKLFSSLGTGKVGEFEMKHFPGAVIDVGRALASTEEKAYAAAEGQKAYDEAFRSGLPAFEKHNEAEKENTRIRKERRKVTEDTTAADLAAGEEHVKGKKAAEDLAKAQLEAANAQAEVDEKTAKAAAAREKKLSQIARDEAQQRFDDEVKNAQKREDIARKNADAIEDIFRDQEKRIADEAKDLSREEEDIAREGSRRLEEIEQDTANQRLEVERDYRKQLQDIQRQFNESAQEAERSNDAQAYLRAMRARDAQLELAQTERDVGLEDVGRESQQQRSTVKAELAQEVEDAKIANVRKLEDLQARLNLELEAQAIKNERDLEQQAIQEERQREQRTLEAQRDLEDFERWQTEKQAKLEESLTKQYEAIAAAKEKELALTAQVEAQKTAIAEAEMERRAKLLAQAEREAGESTLPGLIAGPGRPNEQMTPMAEGGALAAGQTALVGEAGPEVFTAPAAGRIIPNQTMFSPPGGVGPGVANVNNSRSLNVESMGINPGNAVLSRMVQNELSGLMELLG
ncbi:MAG: hypothetical protein GY743_23350 [Planctomycetaceae bacterium]|nr:hypothetical protein [Planctomycetaceae bacterium]